MYIKYIYVHLCLDVQFGAGCDQLGCCLRVTVLARNHQRRKPILQKQQTARQASDAMPLAARASVFLNRCIVSSSAWVYIYMHTHKRMPVFFYDYMYVVNVVLCIYIYIHTCVTYQYINKAWSYPLSIFIHYNTCPPCTTYRNTLSQVHAPCGCVTNIVDT